MSEETKKPKEAKKRQCPFNPKLACEDCRLFYEGKVEIPCVFHRMFYHIEELNLFRGGIR